MSTNSDTSPANWTWTLRPIVLFAATYSIIGILHEGAHAATAYALKIPSQLFHLYANIDRTTGTINEHAIIRVAGPLFCLGVGLVCWLAYRKAKATRAELPLLYLAWFGTATFFGNLISTPSVGDFSGLAVALQWPMAARYAAAVTGLLAVCGLSFFMGMELRKWAPAGAGRARTMLGTVVLPVVAGTAIAIVIFLPIPARFAGARIGESLFWIFAAGAALIRRKPATEESRSLGLGWPDFAMLIVAGVIVRVMTSGIALVP